MWDGSSIGISTVSNPQRLNCGKRLVLWLVKGDVKRKVLMPIRIRELRLVNVSGVSKGFRGQARNSPGPPAPAFLFVCTSYFLNWRHFRRSDKGAERNSYELNVHGAR